MIYLSNNTSYRKTTLWLQISDTNVQLKMQIIIDLFWNNAFIVSLVLHYFNVACAWYYTVHTAIIHVARYSGLMYWSKHI